MGTPEFSVPSLKILVESGFKVVAVITAPDRPAGRGRKLSMSAVKTYALSQNIPVLQPTNLKSPEFNLELKSYQANLQVVVAFRMLPEIVWDMPEYGTFNLHASLLPQYRGAAPINWAIINGEKETGATTFFLQHEIDTGNIILQEKVAITDADTAGSLYERLMHKGAELVLETTQSIMTHNPEVTQQVMTPDLKPAPKIHKETCKIDWNQNSVSIRNFIRGLSPYPAAWTMVNGKNCKFFQVELVKDELEQQKEPGEFITDQKNFIYFKTSDGWVSIKELQLEGKRRMTVEDFLRGATL